MARNDHHDQTAERWDFTAPKRLRRRIGESAWRQLIAALRLIAIIYIAVTAAGLTVAGIVAWLIKTKVMDR